MFIWNFSTKLTPYGSNHKKQFDMPFLVDCWYEYFSTNFKNFVITISANIMFSRVYDMGINLHLFIQRLWFWDLFCNIKTFFHDFQIFKFKRGWNWKVAWWYSPKTITNSYAQCQTLRKCKIINFTPSLIFYQTFSNFPRFCIIHIKSSAANISYSNFVNI